MSFLSELVVRHLQSSSCRSAIAGAAKSWMRRRIDESVGRAPGGEVTRHAPLNPPEGERWVRKPGKSDRVSQSRYRVVGRRTIIEYSVPVKSYREGGHPLKDTGALYQSLSAKAYAIGDGVVMVVMDGKKYGKHHETGYTVPKGAVVPLNKDASRDPGMVESHRYGIDYVVLRGPSKIPARPFVMPLPSDVADMGRKISDSLSVSLRQSLKGG